MAELAQYYKWKRVMIVSRETGLCSYSSQAIFSQLSRMEIIIPAWITFSDLTEETMDDILDNILYKSRSKSETWFLWHRKTLVGREGSESE